MSFYLPTYYHILFLASGSILGLWRHLRWGPCGGLLASLDRWLSHNAKAVGPATTPHRHPIFLSRATHNTTQGQGTSSDFWPTYRLLDRLPLRVPFLLSSPSLHNTHGIQRRCTTRGRSTKRGQTPVRPIATRETLEEKPSK
jgi:hypothetical protein